MLQHTYHVSTEQTHGAAEVEVLSVRPSACGLGTTPDIVRETTSNTLTITVTETRIYRALDEPCTWCVSRGLRCECRVLSQADTARQTKRNVVLANPHRGHVIKAFGTGDDCDREAAIYRELLSHGVPGLVAFARPSTRRRHVIRMQYAKGPGAIGKIPERLMSGHVFARLITEVFTTLRTAHDTCGFCHNDLHRDNIMVTGTGSAADPFRAVLVDFDRASTTQTPQRAGVPQGSHNEDLARLMRIGHAILKHVRVSPHIRTAFLRLKRRVEHMRSVDVSTEPFFQIAREPPECHAIDCT